MATFQGFQLDYVSYKALGFELYKLYRAIQAIYSKIYFLFQGFQGFQDFQGPTDTLS